jgi:hypothetical protein
MQQRTELRLDRQGGVHGKAPFNLLGGYVSFDMDVTRTNAR